jgi:hypothetical protein
MRVRTGSESECDKAVARIREQEKGREKKSISRDRTKKEREETRQLLQEADRRKAAGHGDFVIKNRELVRLRQPFRRDPHK